MKVQFHWDREGQADDKQQLLVARCLRLGGKDYWRHRHPAGRHGSAGGPSSKAIRTSRWSPAASSTGNIGCPTNCRRQTRSVFKSLSSPGGGGSNELRIEDRKGQEQIFVHAQRDWDENIEHDQKIRVGANATTPWEANSYSEFRAEEQRTTHAERKVEVRASDHPTAPCTIRHLKIASGRFVEAGQEIHRAAV